MAQKGNVHKSKMGEEECSLSRSVPMTTFPPTPLGLEALYSLCRRIYPDQMNPLQVTALVKYWYVFVNGS
jgi:hypothetical protein